MAPDVCFAEAHSVGSGHGLELLALERAAEHLLVVDGYVAMNVSPATLLTPECGALLGRLPLDRVLLELSEHDQVEDYATLNAALAPFRADGLRLAIDDVGAGFSSLRHIVVTAPDVIKIDRSIVAGLDTDPVLDDARPLAGRVRPRLRGARRRRGRRDRRGGGRAARPGRRLRPGLALRAPRPARGPHLDPAAGRRPRPPAGTARAPIAKWVRPVTIRLPPR